jgi:hypothetical protein
MESSLIDYPGEQSDSSMLILQVIRITGEGDFFPIIRHT